MGSSAGSRSPNGASRGVTITETEESGLYTVSEMASLFGVSRQTLIYYDKIGLFKPAKVNDRGYRFYSPTQIPLMRLITLLRDVGLDLEEIRRLTRARCMDEIAEKVRERERELDAQMGELEEERSNVQERLRFYDEAAFWKANVGKPKLVTFPTRHIVAEPFPDSEEVGRPILHITLMKAINSMKDLIGAKPMRGWGTMLLRENFHSSNPISGACPYVVVPEGVEDELLKSTHELPEGVYLCMSRWGMPYDPKGIRAVIACLDEHHLQARGNAYDFCYMDATGYDEEHQEDFCCIQVPVEI